MATGEIREPYDRVPVKDTFIYVPILETLKFICRNPDICVFLKKECSSEPNTYSDYFMEVILKPTLYFQPKNMHYKFSCTMMILKQPIPLAPNVEFTKLVVFILL